VIFSILALLQEGFQALGCVSTQEDGEGAMTDILLVCA
jgi:hypothetical protein